MGNFEKKFGKNFQNLNKFDFKILNFPQKFQKIFSGAAVGGAGEKIQKGPPFAIFRSAGSKGEKVR